MFLLSTDQANAITEDVRKCDSPSGADDYYWWLCSPDPNNYRSDLAASVHCFSHGYINATYVKYTLGVRPALKLNLSSVTFSPNTNAFFLPVTGVSLNKPSTTLTVRGTETLTATVTPNGADKSVSWSSSDTSVATVDENGKVTAKAAGTATITVTTTDGGKTATCEVTVNKGEGNIKYESIDVTKTNGDAAFTNSLMNTGDGSVTYASDNTSVATVDPTGKVTIKGAGSAKITATVTDSDTYIYATKTASYTLTVKVAETEAQTEKQTEVTSETEAQEKITITAKTTKLNKSKAKVKKGNVTVIWQRIKKNKLRKKISKIQIQYSTDPTFTTNVQSKKVGKNKTKAKLKLQRKTVYYIRMRYVAKDGGFSNWSKVKRVKTK